jgi:hypothetical protein
MGNSKATQEKKNHQEKRKARQKKRTINLTIQGRKQRRQEAASKPLERGKRGRGRLNA